jgi:hypothetical protein
MLAGCRPAERFERTVFLSESLQSGKNFAAKTHNGKIDVTGTETNTCEISAKITGWAASIEKAQELCEAVEITLQSSKNGLNVIIKKPDTFGNEGTGVSLEVTLPGQTSQTLNTHNGAISINNIVGSVRAETHNGKITANDLHGNTFLKTHNGKINAKNAIGDYELITHNGSVTLAYDQTAGNPERVKVVTHNGQIKFISPQKFSASVTARTHNGSVNTELPITIIGQVDKRNVKGTIGTGKGKLHLETHNGSISIK